MGRRGRRAGGSTPTAATSSRAATTCWPWASSTCSSCPPSPAWRTSPAARSTPPAGTTTTRAVGRVEPLTELGDKVVGAHRHRRDGHPVPAAAGRGGEARLRVPAHAVGHRRARATARPTPEFAAGLDAGLAAGADGQLPGRHARPAGRRGPRRRRLDPPLRRRPAPAPPEGHDASRSTSAAPRSSTSRIMEEHRQRVAEVVEDPATAEALKPYYRYMCKRPCFHDEYLTAFNQPNVTLVDCPAGIERVTERGPVVDGEQYERRLPRLRHRVRGRAHPAVPPRRPRHHRARAASSLAEQVGRRRRQPLRDDEPGLPEPVRHAGARPAGRGDGQLHPARRARRRVRRPAPSPSSTERGVRCST